MMIPNLTDLISLSVRSTMESARFVGGWPASLFSCTEFSREVASISSSAMSISLEARPINEMTMRLPRPHCHRAICIHKSAGHPGKLQSVPLGNQLGVHNKWFTGRR